MDTSQTPQAGQAGDRLAYPPSLVAMGQARGAQTVAVVSDSVGQVSPEAQERLGITIVPLNVHIREEVYRDGIDVTPLQLYQRMRSERVYPTTSAPPPFSYGQPFRALLEAGRQAILCLTISDKMSSSYNMALEAAAEVLADFPGRRIEVLNTRHVSIVQGFMAMAAGRTAAEGGSLDEVRRAALEAKARSGLAVTVETLDYLVHGGRIGRASYLLGSLIQIRPVLSVDEDGFVVALRKARGEAAALQAIVDVAAKSTEGRRFSLAVMGSDSPERLEKLEQASAQKLVPSETFYSPFTPVVGVHTGPGIVGLGWCCEE